MGPLDETPGSIRILDMETGHYVDTSNYKVLNYMPSAFTRIHPDVWKSTNPINDKGEVKYDLHNQGATYITKKGKAFPFLSY